MNEKKQINCQHYDSELDCCIYLSDWSDPMPVLQPCCESPCNLYEPRKANRCVQSEWISVEERLPEENGEYLVYTKYGWFDVERFKLWDDDDTDGGYWWEYEGIVTHWMPLPEPPTEKEN